MVKEQKEVKEKAEKVKITKKPLVETRKIITKEGKMIEETKNIEEQIVEEKPKKIIKKVKVVKKEPEVEQEIPEAPEPEPQSEEQTTDPKEERKRMLSEQRAAAAEEKKAMQTLDEERVIKAREDFEIFNTERDMAMDFAIKVHQKFDKLIKASILFGSQAKNTSGPSSDLDIALILDDSSIVWDLELIAWYREELGKILGSVGYGKEVHVTTLKLTTWWNDLLHGEAVVINMLRYGEPLIDSGGFFNPLKMLLQNGYIKSTHEAVYAALERAPNHLMRSKGAKMSAVEGAYWTFMESAQAALMTVGKLPPSPEHIPGLLMEEFVQRHLLKEDFVKMVKDAMTIHKGITHGTIREVSGGKIDELQTQADAFLSEMIRIINLILDAGNK